MGYWQKVFTNGNREIGLDEDVDIGKASWSRGCLTDIKEVLLIDGLTHCKLTVPNTEWHQFDRFIVPVAAGKQTPIRTHRVIQAKICEHHVKQYLACSRSGGYFFWAIVSNIDAIGNSFFSKELLEIHVGKWITIILPHRGYPELLFGTRGKLNGNK